MGQLQARERGHVQPVGVGTAHVDPVDAVDGADVAQAPRPFGLGGLRRVDLVEVADAAGEPDVVDPPLVLRAGGAQHVAVAGGVDDLVGQDGLASRLALEDGPAHGAAVEDGVHTPAVEEDVDPGLGDHLDHEVLQGLGVDGGVDAPAAVADAPVELLQAPHHLLADALAHLPAPLDDVADDQQDQAPGPQAAEVAVALDQRGVGPCPTRGDGGRHAGRTGTDDEHLGLVQDGQLAPGLHHPAVDPGGRRVPDGASTGRLGLGPKQRAAGHRGRQPGGHARGAQYAEEFSPGELAIHASCSLLAGQRAGSTIVRLPCVFDPVGLRPAGSQNNRAPPERQASGRESRIRATCSQAPAWEHPSREALLRPLGQAGGAQLRSQCGPNRPILPKRQGLGNSQDPYRQNR